VPPQLTQSAYLPENVRNGDVSQPVRPSAYLVEPRRRIHSGYFPGNWTDSPSTKRGLSSIGRGLAPQTGFELWPFRLTAACPRSASDTEPMIATLAISQSGSRKCFAVITVRNSPIGTFWSGVKKTESRRGTSNRQGYCQSAYNVSMSAKLRTVNGVEEKFCSTCKAWKPFSAFSPGGRSHQGSEGGVHCECKPCNAARHRMRYAAKKQSRRAWD
jgi:RNase P subunit RPR2